MEDGFERVPIADDGKLPPTSDTAALALPEIARDLGFILDEDDEEKVAKHVVQFRKDQEPAMSRRRAVWKRNRWWREGKRWVRIEKKQDISGWTAKLPSGMGSMPPLPNKTDRLCRRLGNTLLVDKPYPECEPADDSNEARDAAEFATRLLVVKGAASELNFPRICRSAFDKSCTYASAFAWVTMDPGAGGHRPRRMLAHPKATHRDNALEDPSWGEEIGIPGLTVQANEDDLQERYVRPDGYLSDDPAEADLQWLAAPKIRLLTGLQLNFLPETARGITDAIGIVITDLTTLGELKTLFPTRFERLTKEDIEALCQWRPANVEDLLPANTKMPEDQKYEDGPLEGEYKDGQVVITTTIYYRSCPEYPYGCYAVIGGETLVLHKQKWTAKMPGPLGPDGAERPPVEECLRIPVSQDRCLDDDTTDDPYGVAIAEHLGAADEISASALGFEVEHMFRAANPHLFIPQGSTVQPGQVLLRNNVPILTNPNGKPEWEAVPALSSTIPELRQEMEEDQNDAIGLQQAAQGVEDPSVKSGIHAQTIVQEALKAVSNMKDNLGDFYVGLCEIILEQLRAYATVPELLTYTGEDGSYKQREWSRTDFGTTKRVAIARGSFTMHTVLGKQQMAREMKADQVIDAEQYMDFMVGSISPTLGAQDNPFLMRIRRQIEQFLEGPPEGWMETATAAMQAVAPALPGMPPAPAPALPPTPFSAVLPVDTEPAAAKIRHRQLARSMATARFERLPALWKQPFITEYTLMKNAAGIVDVPDMQRAQAAAAQGAAAGVAAPAPSAPAIELPTDPALLEGVPG